jgi:hypothetical protein
LLPQSLANPKRASIAEQPDNTSKTPDQEPVVWRSHRTAGSSILSCDFVRKVVGNVVDDDENAETIWREADLYIKHLNMFYPLLTYPQLMFLIQDFISSSSISNMTSGSAGLKRKRSGPEPPGPPQSPMERALVLLIRALGKRYDDTLSLKYKSSPSGSTKFPNGYPTPATSLDNHYETRITGVPPGSEYFAAASEIMANHTGGSSLCHVKAYLLASMYHGQLSQDAQRHHYLFEAARALQIFLQRYARALQIDHQR